MNQKIEKVMAFFGFLKKKHNKKIEKIGENFFTNILTTDIRCRQIDSVIGSEFLFIGGGPHTKNSNTKIIFF